MCISTGDPSSLEKSSTLLHNIQNLKICMKNGKNVKGFK